MSDIPYNFTAIPNFLIDSGWIKDHKTLSLFVHLFRRIRYESHIEVINGREVFLEPFEFIFGRDSVATETGLTPKEVRLRWDQIKGQNMASIVASKTTSRYTVYKWSTSHFIQNNGQQKGQQKGHQQGRQRASNRATKKSEEKRMKIKEGDSYDDQMVAPIFTSCDVSPASPDSLEGRFVLMNELLNCERIKNFRLMDGSEVPRKVMERWVAKLMGDIFYVLDWYDYRVLQVLKKKTGQILNIQYIEGGITKAHWKQYLTRGKAAQADLEHHERLKKQGAI